MASPRIVGTFNIKDPEIQAIYSEITGISRGLLSDICCAAIRQWKGQNLNIDETKRALAELDKESAIVEEQRLKLQQRLKMLELTRGIKDEHIKEAEKVSLDKVKETGTAFDAMQRYFGVKDPAKVEALVKAWWMERSTNDITSGMILDKFLVFFAQKYALRFIKNFPFLSRQNPPSEVLPLDIHPSLQGEKPTN